jgi:hypothetical protein
LLLGLLGGCVHQIDYRAGASTAELARERDDCALRALEAAPVKLESRMIPGRFIPERRVCDAAGNCTVYPARQEFPQWEDFDINAEKRALLTRTCLANKGIDRVSLPYCDAAAKASVTPGVTRILPPLNEVSCVIPRGAGAYQIVTR